MSHDSDQSPKGRDPQGLDAKHASAVPEGQSPEHSRDREIAALRDALIDLAEAARNACDAKQHPSLTEALFEADCLLIRTKDTTHGQ